MLLKQDNQKIELQLSLSLNCTYIIHKMIFTFQKIFGSCIIMLCSLISQSSRNQSLHEGKDFDVAIINGRVIDPESNLDEVINIGIRDGSVELMTAKEITGKTIVDAHDLVVAPGFIDIHQHGQDHENYSYKVMDGVTTALELEMGTADVDSWYREREGKTLIKHGVSVGHVPLRMKICNGWKQVNG
jgi:hypothetical protein